MTRAVHSLLAGILLIAGCQVVAQRPFAADTTMRWEEVIARYQVLADAHRAARLMEIGKDDDGSPIHLFVVSDGNRFAPDSIRATGRGILFIINGIHPGEPDGIDASLMLARALLESDQLMGLTSSTAVCIIPVYNVGGARRWGPSGRQGQQGPPFHGQRANARHLDLNRDLIKADARNTQVLVQALRRWDPDVLIDTHVSDGSDHRYVMQLLTTQKDKLDPGLAAFLTGTMIPALYQWMDRRKVPMCPYFETLRQVPDSGVVGFMDSPRYTTGYAALWNTIGIMSESHMLKPYRERVNATYQLMLAVLAVMDRHRDDLRRIRQEAQLGTTTADHRVIAWKLDSTAVEQLPFKGYATEWTTSAVTGQPRLRYDQHRPVELVVDRLDRYVPAIDKAKPAAYIIPQAWREVIQRLALNGVFMERIGRDTVLTVEVQHLEAWNTPREPREGRYPHTGVLTRTTLEQVHVAAGDLWLPMGQVSDRFVMEVLEPEAPDSYFAWNFFDALLQQKEWFSPYLFEDRAEALLREDTVLRERFEQRRAADPVFAADAFAQLLFLFRASPYMERDHLRYPVLRMPADR